MGSGNILAGAPELYMLEYLNDDLCFAMPEVASIADPYICFARIVYHPDKRQEAIPYWQNVFAETKKESGTFVYGIIVEMVPRSYLLGCSRGGQDWRPTARGQRT